MTSVEPVDTVVLDVDGTLVDSVYLHVEAWMRAFETVGVEVAAWRVHRSIGLGGDRFVAEVAGDDAEADVGDKVRELHDAAFEEMLPRVRPLPSAADLLSALDDRGLIAVVASSGDPDQTRRMLSTIGTNSVLRAVVTAGDADRSKPAPDLLEAAVAEVDRDRALVVGDATWDMQAARNLQWPAVGLRTGGFGVAELDEAGAQWVYDGLPDLIEHLDRMPLSRVRG